MRIILALPLLLMAACNVERDEANDQTTLEFNEQRIEGAAEDVANTAEDVATGVGNVVGRTADAIGNEVGDVDVDVNVSRDKDSHDGNRQ